MAATAALDPHYCRAVRAVSTRFGRARRLPLYYAVMATVLEISLWVGAGLWIVFLLQFIINWILVPDLRKVTCTPPDRWPLVSIVVPARDEERGVRAAVTSFCKQDYPAFEVIVVDDRSTDATPRILAELQADFEHLTVVKGQEPPEGWLGKPNALEIGRKHAKGEWLLFVDADVVYAPDLLRRALRYALREQAGMLFLYPRLTTGEVLEAVTMSTLYLAAFAACPMFLVSRTKNKLLALGGGVFNLVRRDALEASGAFESLRNAVVDDVGMGRVVKAAGYRQAVALAGALIRIRMYGGFCDTVEGFSKNAYPMFRRHWWLLPIPVFVGALVSLLPYVGFASALAGGSVSVPASISLACMHVILAVLALRFRQSWCIVFLNPVRELSWWWILLRSFIRYRRHGVVWRGRTYGSSV